MSMRIGNAVYLDGMEPIEVEPLVAAYFERIAQNFEVNEDTLIDLIALRPGGVVRVGKML